MSSEIEWTGNTWPVIVGCSRVSRACYNCYAINFAARLEAMSKAETDKGKAPDGKAIYVGLTEDRGGRLDWKGIARFNPQVLPAPLQWIEPQFIFPVSMGDLFHHSIMFADIAAIHGVMLYARRHTFQTLTKRPSFAATFYKRWSPQDCQKEAQKRLEELGGWKLPPPDPSLTWKNAQNIWHGCSIEDEAAAEQRLEPLHEIPGLKWISYAPALGVLDIPASLMPDWIVAEGESGPHAEPSRPAHFRGIRDLCTDRGTPFFFKTWGRWAPAPAGQAPATLPKKSVELDGITLYQWPGKTSSPDARLLDGQVWEQYPERKS